MATIKGNVATSAVNSLYDVVPEYLCTLCAKKNRNMGAIHLCVECREYLCSKCTDSHNSFVLMSTHTLLQKSHFPPKDAKHNSGTMPNEHCPRHPAEFIKMYCGIHDQVGCSVCITVNHKSCHNIQYIPDIDNKCYNYQTISDAIGALNDASLQMKILKQSLCKFLTELTLAKSLVLQAIDKFKKEVNELMDELEKATVKELDSQCECINTQLQAHIQKINVIVNELNKYKDQANNIQQNSSQQFVWLKISQESISHADEMRSELLPCSIQMSFSENMAIKSCFKQFSKFGTISQCVQQARGLYKIHKSSKHNVKTKSDSSTCNILASCVMDSGALLLADWENEKLKLFDIDKNVVISYCTLAGAPNAVCSVSDIEAAASLDNVIQFVSVTNILVPTRVLSLEYSCIGLVSTCGKMYTTTRGANVYVHTLGGKLLKTISKDESGQPIFTDSCRVALSNNSNIHVADLKNGLITLDKDGRVLWKYSGSDLRNICDVSTDALGNVFVCGYTSHNVIQIRHDGQRLGEIITNSCGLSKPRSVCFDAHNLRLIISNDKDDNIMVFSLK